MKSHYLLSVIVMLLVGLSLLGNLTIHQTTALASPNFALVDQNSNSTSTSTLISSTSTSSGTSSTSSSTTTAASSSTISTSSTTTTSSTQTTASSSTSSTSSTTSLTSSSQTKTTALTVPSISLNPASGSVGLTVDVSGTGFSTGDTTCSISGSVVASQTCSISNGALTAAFTVANVAGSAYSVTATGGQEYDSASATFTVNAVPPSITFNPSSAQVGATVEVSGSSFQATDTTCSLSGNPITVSTCSISSGTLTATFTVGDVASGVYTIMANGSPGGDSASGSFTVTSVASILLSPDSASIGASVDVSGSGFSSTDTSCSLSGSPVGTSSCSISSGSLYASFVVASVAASSYTITATGTPNGDSASATFTVNGGNISITLNPASAQVGVNVQVSGSGFSSSDTVCNLSGGSVTSETCSISDGTLTGSFVVGDVTPDSYTVSATGSPAEDSVSATFTVSSSALSITLNPTSASVGSTIQVTGVGFSTSDSACSVSDGSSIASETCSVADGSISASFIVANVATGSYTITVIGSPMDDSASATLTVTSSAGSITLNPSSAQVGATVQVSGSGFPSTDSSCSLSGGAVSSPSCSISSGALSGSFIVSNVTTGSYAVAALSSPSDDSVSATFTVSSPSSAETTSTNTTHSSSLTTAASDFSLTSTSIVTLTQGGSGSAIVTVISVNGFNGTVTLVASWLGYTPQGVNLSITSPITPLPNGTVAVPLTVTASSTASTGTFAVQVTGTSGTLTHSLVSAILVQVSQSASTTSNTSTMTSSASSINTSTSITSSIPALPTVCPVSTATSGSALAPLAQALRTFRDESIMKTRTGIAFMTLFNTWYYSFSPRLASYIGSHQNQRTIFRYSLYPLIGVLYASYYSYILVSPFNAEIAAVTSGLVAAGLIGAAYLALPLYLAKRILKRKTLSSSWLKATHLLACSIISGLAVGISYYAGIEVALSIATASLILSTLMLGAILGSMVLARIDFTYLVREFATLNRTLGRVFIDDYRIARGCIMVP